MSSEHLLTELESPAGYGHCRQYSAELLGTRKLDYVQIIRFAGLIPVDNSNLANQMISSLEQAYARMPVEHRDCLPQLRVILAEKASQLTTKEEAAKAIELYVKWISEDDYDELYGFLSEELHRNRHAEIRYRTVRLLDDWFARGEYKKADYHDHLIRQLQAERSASVAALIIRILRNDQYEPAIPVLASITDSKEPLFESDQLGAEKVTDLMVKKAALQAWEDLRFDS